MMPRAVALWASLATVFLAMVGNAKALPVSDKLLISSATDPNLANFRFDEDADGKDVFDKATMSFGFNRTIGSYTFSDLTVDAGIAKFTVTVNGAALVCGTCVGVLVAFLEPGSTDANNASDALVMRVGGIVGGTMQTFSFTFQSDTETERNSATNPTFAIDEATGRGKNSQGNSASFPVNAIDKSIDVTTALFAANGVQPFRISVFSDVDVPEPSSLSLLLAGLGVAILRFRRSRRNPAPG